MSYIDTLEFNDTQNNKLYNKIYGINSNQNKIFDDTSIDDFNKKLIRNYNETLINDLNEHDDYVLDDIVINGNKVNIEKFKNPSFLNHEYVKPIGIDKFIEVDRASTEFKNNICLRKLEFKLMLLLQKYLETTNVEIFFKKNPDEVNLAKELYNNNSSHKLNVDWTKLGKLEVGGILFINPKPSQNVSTTKYKANILKLYKIIFIGVSPHVGRKECIVVRHILFPKYYIHFTGFGGTSTEPVQNLMANKLGIVWYLYHAAKDMSSMINHNKKVNIQCNDETITTQVHKWHWEQAERHTLNAIKTIESDFISWWHDEINSDVKTLEDITHDYCFEGSKKTYCNTNQNKKNTYFYNACIPVDTKHCCNAESVKLCLEPFPINTKSDNKLAKKIKSLGMIYFNKSNDNFKQFRHGRSDISILGTSMGGGVGTLSILVLIDYFSKKNLKIFNIDGSFYNAIKSTNDVSFDIMKKYDNIAPINLVNTKLEFIIKPNKKYHIALDILKKNSQNPRFNDIQEKFNELHYGKINHITDMFNFIPGICIDPYTMTNFIDHASAIPFTYYYLGCVDSLYKDISAHNGKLCPQYKQLLGNDKIDNNDISNKIFKFANYSDRNIYDLTIIEFTNLTVPRVLEFWKLAHTLGNKLHIPANTRNAMDKIYKDNECNEHGYEY